MALADWMKHAQVTTPERAAGSLTSGGKPAVYTQEDRARYDRYLNSGYDPAAADRQAAIQAGGGITTAQYHGPTSAQLTQYRQQQAPTQLQGASQQAIGWQHDMSGPHATHGAQPAYAGDNQSASGMTSLGANQVTKPTQPAPGLVAGAQSPTLNVPANNAIAQAGYQTMDPIYRTVQDNELSRTQLDAMMADDSPLLMRARERARASMAANGMTNSSMAIGAAEGAAWDAAQPFALQDAATYGQAARDNQLVGNSAQEFNAGAYNKNQEVNTGYINRRGDINVQEAGMDRRLDKTEQGLYGRQQITEKGLGDRLLISEAGDTARQDSVNRTNVETTGMNNRTTLDATRMNNETSITTTGMNNQTSLGVANIGAAASRYSSDSSAAASRYSADSNAASSRYSADTQRDVSRYNADSAAARDQNRMIFEADQNMNNRLQQIDTNPDMTQEYRDGVAQRIIEASRRTQDLINSVDRVA